MQHITQLEPLPYDIWARLMTKATKSGDCWIWNGYRLPGGYGQISVGNKRMRLAHRVAYTVAVGEIPDGMELDHLCRNTSCINPAHLEPVTPSVNARRGNTIAARNAAKTHCKRGHEFTPENTAIAKGKYRNCLICKRARQAKARKGSA